MSSETSTEVPRAGDLHASASRSEPLQPWQLFTLAGLIGATIVVFLSRGQSPAGVIVLSLAVFAAAIIAVATLRTLLPLTRSVVVDAPQLLGGRTRAALEREKALVLRSIKELEFDRAMGKISEKDFAEMSGRLRSRAAGLIRQLDAGSVYRQEIEREVARRLAKAGSAPRNPSVAPASTPVGTRVEQSETVAGATGTALAVDPDAAHIDATCPSCRTSNDPDARFCKGCGVRLEASA